MSDSCSERLADCRLRHRDRCRPRVEAANRCSLELSGLPTGFAADHFTFAQNVKGTGKRSLNLLSGTYRLVKKFPAVQEWRAAEVASEIYTQSEYTVLILSIDQPNRHAHVPCAMFVHAHVQCVRSAPSVNTRSHASSALTPSGRPRPVAACAAIAAPSAPPCALRRSASRPARI